MIRARALAAALVAALAVVATAPAAVITAPANQAPPDGGTPNGAARLVVWSNLKGASMGGISGAAMACVTFSFEIWQRVGFWTAGKPDAQKCLAAFMQPAVAAFHVGGVAQHGHLWAVNATVDGTPLLFLVAHENSRLVIIRVAHTTPPSCHRPACN